MATTINYPYQITTLSAKGSAEVIARGITNDYITEWSYNTNTIGSWDRVADFPTVVRTGNFVWCWYREYLDRAIYVLIDVVPDPQVEYQLGNNIAYPALLNGSVGEITYAVTPANIKTINTGSIPGPDNSPDLNTVTDGPYYKLAVGNKYVHVTGTTAGYKAGFYNSDRSYKEIVADKWGRTPNVWRGFATANATYVPWVIGWGTSQSLLTSTNTDDGDTIYGIFAPFATYEQFQTLYGAEKDWIYSTSGSSYKTLFGPTYDTSNNAGIQYTNTSDIENDYPFTVEEMQPQTNYRDIPGDTNQDGIDDSTSFEDALATYAVAASVFPGLDITKCGNLADLSIKLPGIDLPSINELKNTVKAGIDTAVSSTGLLELGKKLEGFKAGLKDKLPKVPQIENLAKDISDLKDASEDELGELKKKWENAVEDIEGIIDDVRNLGGFDVCQFVTDKAKTDEDGNLVKKNDAPSPPDIDMVESSTGGFSPYKEDYVTAPAALNIGWNDGDYLKYRAMLTSKMDVTRTADLRAKYPWAQYSYDFPIITSNLEEFLKSPLAQKVRKLKNNKSPVPPSDLQEYNRIGTPLVLEFKRALLVNNLHQQISVFVSNALSHVGKRILKDYSPIPVGGDVSKLWYGLEERGYYKDYPIGGNVGDPAGTPVIWRKEDDDVIQKFVKEYEKYISENILTKEIIEEGEFNHVGFTAHYEEPTGEPVARRVFERSNVSGVDPGPDISTPPHPREFIKSNSGKVFYTKGFKSKIRNQPIRADLFGMLEATASELGCSFEITSGGQPVNGILGKYGGGGRTGSHRHDNGYAADVKIRNKNGRLLGAKNANVNARDRKELSDIIVSLLKNGITSVGAGTVYMGGTAVHLDITPSNISPAAVWGNNDSRSGAPGWLISLYDAN